MDDMTLAAYDASAEAFAREWLEQPEPADLHALVKQYFVLGPTADIGCGSGREVARLTAKGYPTVGYDVLLNEESLSASSGKTIHRIVARKNA